MAAFAIPKIKTRKEETPMARKKKSQSPSQEDARIQEFLDMIVPSVIKLIPIIQQHQTFGTFQTLSQLLTLGNLE